MPLVQMDESGHREDISPDEALKRSLCPECGGDLVKQDATAHLNSHWRSEPLPGRMGDEARRRRSMLQEFIKNRAAAQAAETKSVG